MGFKTQRGFQKTTTEDGLKYVSGKRQSWYMSEQGAVGAESLGTQVFDFTDNSLPSNWVNYAGTVTGFNVTPTNIRINSGYLEIKGDAGNYNQSYPIRYTEALQGDNLIQLSFYAGDSNCRDWGMAVSGTTYTNTSTSNMWNWAWSSQSNRIAWQCDCSNAQLYPKSGGAQNTGSGVDTGTGTWYTAHFMVYTSSASTKLKITTGQKDWQASGTQKGSLVNVAQRIVSNDTTDYWMGISSDNDLDTYAKADAVRITDNSSEFF